MDYVRALGRRWKTIAVCVLVAVAVGGVFSLRLPPPAAPPLTFRATTYLWASSTSSFVVGDNSLQGVATIALLPEVPARTARATNFRGTPAAFLELLEVVPDDVTHLVSISASAPTAPRAEQIADTFSEELLGYLEERSQIAIDEANRAVATFDRELAAFERAHAGEELTSAESDNRDALESGRALAFATLTSAQSGGTSGLEVIEPAVAVPVSTSGSLWPPRSRSTSILLAGALGLLVGIAIALIRERLDPTIQDREQAEHAFGLPVLADIPKTPRRYRRSVIVSAAPGAPTSNGYQLLAAGLLFGRHRPSSPPARPSRKRPVGQKMLVTSAIGSDGEASTVANLAAAFAGVGKKVIVVSCVSDDPGLQIAFEVERGPGLSEALDGASDLSLKRVLHPTNVEGVQMIPPGEAIDATMRYSLFSSARMESLLGDAASAADIVLIAAAPILEKSDWTHLITKIDAVLVVARVGTTTWGSAERSAELLRMLQAPVAGVVLNGVPASSVRSGHARRPSTYRERETDEGQQQAASVATEAEDAVKRSSPSPRKRPAGAKKSTATTRPASGKEVERPDDATREADIVVVESAPPVVNSTGDQPNGNGPDPTPTPATTPTDGAVPEDALLDRDDLIAAPKDR